MLPIGCITRGRKGQKLTDMKELAQAGAIAFSDDGDPVMNDAVMDTALKTSRQLNMLVIDHCENKELTLADK